MAPSKVLSLATFMLVLPAALAIPSGLTPLSELLGLDKRDCVTKSVHYDSCNICDAGGEGAPPDCRQEAYYHNGASGFSCNDERTFFDTSNFCQISENGMIHTPFGDGVWKVADGCSESNDQGTYAGTIVEPNGGQDWACSCVNAAPGTTGDNFCGEEYACTEIWSCACSKCT